MRASMSRRGNCYDNAPIESFWGSLKSELIYHRRFATREQARLAISEYIEMFYNRQRTQAPSGLPVACRIYAAILSGSRRCLTRWPPPIPTDLKPGVGQSERSPGLSRA